MKNLLPIAFLEGGLVMLLELMAPNLVTPIWGNSIFIWALMLSSAVGMLAIGYFIGGKLNGISSSKEKSIIQLFTIALLSTIVGLIGVKMLNASIISDGETSIIWIIVVLTTYVPLVSFGATTPLIVGVLSSTEKNFTVGKVYAVSTYGGVLFALLTGYLFIPSFGVTNTLVVAIVFLLLLQVLFYVQLKNKNQLIFSLLGMVILIGSSFISKTNTSKQEFEILYSKEGINGHVMVADLHLDSAEQRILFINRMGQTWIDKSNKFSMWSYPNIVTALGDLYPENSRSLVLGLGGGIVAKQLRNFTGHRVDAVELDQRIIDVAYDYFDLPNNGVNVFNQDARSFINASTDKYDFILFDIFNGEIAPSHTLSVEAFEKTKELLSKKGLVVINFNGFDTGIEAQASKSLLNTLKKVGFTIKQLPTLEEGQENKNNLFLAFINEPNWSVIDIKINTLAGQVEVEDLISDPVFDTSAPIITDNKPLMEKLNYPAAKKWRESYYKNFTKKYNDLEGVPYFF